MVNDEIIFSYVLCLVMGNLVEKKRKSVNGKSITYLLSIQLLKLLEHGQFPYYS